MNPHRLFPILLCVLCISGPLRETLSAAEDPPLRRYLYMSTPDGKRLYSPTGWWHQGDDAGFLVIDAADGELIERKPVGPKAHNSIASLDGKFVYLGTITTLTQFDAPTGKVLQTITPVGEQGVFPYTIDSRNRFAFVCLGGHVGFDVVDLEKGEPIHRVFATDENGDQIPHRTHGAGLTPDESELWISDQKGQKLFIFDATVMPPAPKGHVELSMAGHGWVCFSLDGAYTWCHTPDVFDTRTKKQVATHALDQSAHPRGAPARQRHAKERLSFVTPSDRARPLTPNSSPLTNAYPGPTRQQKDRPTDRPIDRTTDRQNHFFSQTSPSSTNASGPSPSSHSRAASSPRR